MLLNNGTFNSQYPGRELGGSYAVFNRAMWNKPNEAWQRFWSDASFDKLSSTPSGYRDGSQWIMAMKPGGLSSHNRVAGIGAPSGLTMAQGRAVEGTVTGSGVVSSANETAKGNLTVTLAGTCTLPPLAIAGAVYCIATLPGSCTQAASIRGGLSGAATLSGTGGSVAFLNALVGIFSSIEGSGSVHEANLAGGKYGTITITGAGAAASPDLRATANLEAEVSLGGMSVTIDSSAVADAVMSAAVETGITFHDAVRILLRVAAGRKARAAIQAQLG